MGATLIESPDEHHWVLLDHQVTQISVDVAGLRIQTWSLEASAEVRCASRFTFRHGSGAERILDPADAETLAPVLGLIRRRLESITVSRDGDLTVAFSGGVVIVASRARAGAGWEVHGAGALEGMSYGGALPQSHGR